MDVATDQLDRLIERRSDASEATDPDTTEASYLESVRRYHARRRNEDLWDQLRYHEAMLESHTRTFMQLLDKHRVGVSSCEHLLGIGEDRG